MSEKAAAVFIFLILLGVIPPALAGESKNPPLQDTREWLELAHLWRQLSEHWTRRVVSKEELQARESEISVALPTLITLQARDYFDEQTRVELEQLFQQRLRFIREQCYQFSTRVALMNLEIYTFQAHSRLEELLSQLLWPAPASKTDVEKARDKAHAALAVELEFLKRAAALNALISFHRAQAQEAQAKGAKVDWGEFNLEAARRIRVLIDDYLNGKIKPGKAAFALQRLVISLTEEPLQ